MLIEKPQQIKFHREDDHPLVVPTQTMGEPATGDKRNKFPGPEFDKVQTLEVWETFIANWEEYKR